MADPYVIIGDGIAGSSAAEALREHDPDADIEIVTDEDEPLYNRILIKEYAKGKLPESPVHIHDREWYEEKDIDLRLDTCVVDVDTSRNEIITEEGAIPYSKLLVATGGTPRHLPVPNADADGVHSFWTIQDARRIREAASAADTGVVIGAGLLGIDLAAVCGEQDIDATYLMRGDRWWRYGLTNEGAEIIHTHLEEMGVTPNFGVGAERFLTDQNSQVTAVEDTDGNHHEAEFVGVAIGLDYNTAFLQDTPVEIDGGIHVDATMQTSVPDVYAAGDITRYHDLILGEENQNGSWDSAQEQGKVAAKNMLGDSRSEFRFVPSYSITHFDTPFLSFGHPTKGDDACSRKYSETEWRRLTFKDGRLIGGVLIGNLAPQRLFNQLIEEGMQVADRKEELLERNPDSDGFDV